MDYTFTNGIEAKAGIVPLSDKFGDMLFSSDWDYNPVALAFESDIGPGRLRVFATQLNEGDEPIAHDDFSHYQMDYVLKPMDGLSLNTGVTYADVADAYGRHTKPHFNYGLAALWGPEKGWKTRMALMDSYTDKNLLGTESDGQGLASKIELIRDVGRHTFGLMATYATGKRDGSGFISGAYGYWGYTRILTVQGPTDTGFDGDAVNISNNGYGLTTLQAKYAFAVTDDLDLYLAAGWFGNSSTPHGRSGYLGINLLSMFTYHFNKVLALDFGADYTHLKDRISGYSHRVIGGAVFNTA
ncbi:MAG: hypothetical protein ACUVQV_07770 [Dissulfurimicrobium sp.]|uniref:hypothetical protein n=1 Tax=Dissulfurimicrobium sp. TaxID=2022436 RepID=UPI00404990A0